MKNDEVSLLDIIFDSLKFYDNDFVLQLLCYYNDKTTISISDLIQQIDKFKISKSTKYTNNNTDKYLINECNKKEVNIYIIKYLIEHGANINKEDRKGETPLFNVCRNGNEIIVKYLVKHGADVNKENKYGKTPLFDACFSGNEKIVKYIVEHGAEINKEILNGETPLFEACLCGNLDTVKYLTISEIFNGTWCRYK